MPSRGRSRLEGSRRRAARFDTATRSWHRRCSPSGGVSTPSPWRPSHARETAHEEDTNPVATPMLETRASVTRHRQPRPGTRHTAQDMGPHYAEVCTSDTTDLARDSTDRDDCRWGNRCLGGRWWQTLLASWRPVTMSLLVGLPSILSPGVGSADVRLAAASRASVPRVHSSPPACAASHPDVREPRAGAGSRRGHDDVDDRRFPRRPLSVGSRRRNLHHAHLPSDLDITLTSPAGTVVTLTTDNGGTADDVFNGTLWDDQAGVTNAPGSRDRHELRHRHRRDAARPGGIAGRVHWRGPQRGVDPHDRRRRDRRYRHARQLAARRDDLRGRTVTGSRDVHDTTSTPIVDNATATSTLTVSGIAPLLHDLTVSTTITHTFPRRPRDHADLTRRYRLDAHDRQRWWSRRRVRRHAVERRGRGDRPPRAGERRHVHERRGADPARPRGCGSRPSPARIRTASGR